jgi:hypothetical protein
VAALITNMRTYIRFLLLVVGFLLVIPALGDTTNAPSVPPSEIDDFNPGLGIFAALMIMLIVVVCMLLVGLGLVTGVVLCALSGFLAGLGILSSSVAIAFVRRSPGSGFRALFIQLGALAGIPVGIGAVWLASWAAHTHWSTAFRIVVGGTCGLACGVAVALVFNFVWGKVAQWILRRYERRPEPEKRAEVIGA